MTKRKDLTGMRFSRLLVLGFDGVNKNKKSIFKCRCDCGNEITAVGGNLTSGVTNSCGCYKRDAIRNSRTIHGFSAHPSYARYLHMIRRCDNPENPEYHNYGGRGIKVCDRWRSSIANFIADMGEPPSKEYSIDRSNNDGDYTPENCRWATNTEQNINRRVTRWLSLGDESFCEKEWSERLGMNKHSVAARINRGWDLEKALSTPRIEKGKYARHDNSYRYS